MERSPAIIRYIVFIQYDDAFKITFNMNTEFRLKLFYSVANNIQSIIPVHLTNKENLLLCRRVEDPILATECRAK